MVNRYDAMARSHWARWLPQRYATISDPDSFFSKIGQEAARQIDELTTELAGENQPGEDYLARAGRLAAVQDEGEQLIDGAGIRRGDGHGALVSERQAAVHLYLPRLTMKTSTGSSLSTTKPLRS